MNIVNKLYVTFKDGSMHQLNNAKIRYYPNQSLIKFAGADLCEGIIESSEPIEPYKLDDKYRVLEGQEEYKLTFENLINEKFINEPFYLGDIEFHLLSYGVNGHVEATAFGRKK